MTIVEERTETIPLVVAPDDVAPPERRARLMGAPWLPLLLVVGLQAAMTLRLHNSAFQDEALYLYAGHQLTAHALHGRPLFDNYASYFSGAPGFYPVIGSIFDSIGGLFLARLFSLVWMGVATCCVYGVTRRLFDRQSALFAATLFGCSASVLFVGAMATFDALCLGLLAVGAWLSMVAAGRRRPWLAIAVGPLLALAVTAKYAGGLFVPSVFALLALETYRRRRFLQALLRPVLAMVGAALTVFAIYLRFGTVLLDGIRQTTTARKPAVVVPAAQILDQAVRLGGLVVLLALLSLVTLRRRLLLIGLLLVGTSVLPWAYHALKGEPVSLSKHVAFGLFFAAPLAGLSVSRVARDRREHATAGRSFAALSICLVVLGLGVSQSKNLHDQWPDSSRMVAVVGSQVRPGVSRILVEEPEVPRYYLANRIAPWEWTGLNWYQYRTRSGQLLQGGPAYRAAIDAGVFDIVVLQYGYNAALAHSLDDSLNHVGPYDQIAKIPYSDSFGTGSYVVWRRR